MSPNSSLIPLNADDDFNKQNGSDQNATSITTNGNFIIFLPFHLVQEILGHLDAQTSFKCAFLCRGWNSFITSPDFISQNSRRNFDSRSQLLVIDEVLDGGLQRFSPHWDNDQFDFIHTVESPPIFDGFKGRVVGTSNGLVCVSNLFQKRFALWNPTIRKYVTHPTPPCDRKVTEIMSRIAFGFDDRSNDFKVIYLAKNARYEPLMAWVFSYVTWSWKCLTARPPPCQVPNCKNNMLFMNGVLHLFAWHYESYFFILTLDLGSEVFGEIFLPASIMGPDGCISIVQMGNSLAVVQKIRRNYDRFGSWSVWVMKQSGDHDSWTNIINRREEDHVYDLHDDSLIPINLLAMKNQDMIIETRGGQIVRYNPTTTTTKLLRQQPNIRKGAYVLVHDYAESLYFLEKGGNVTSY